MTVFTNVKKEDLKGFGKQEPSKTIYEVLRLKNGAVTLILYTSGKLFLQGPKRDVEQLAQELTKKKIGEKEQPLKFKKETGIVIGSDESLKGDTFGGIVVAAVKADDAMRQKLVELGVADSKTLQDKEILVMAEKIKKDFPCEIKSLLPQEYNAHHGQTALLNRLHAECAQFLNPGKHIVDKYPGCSVGDIQEEKAESKYVEVAAASILARASALKQLDSLSILAGFPLPKGSTHVGLALQELKARNLDFKQFVKVDFGNVREFMEEI